jgi:hypothetical protein
MNDFPDHNEDDKVSPSIKTPPVEIIDEMYGNISVNNPEDDVKGIFLSGNLEQSGSIGVHALQDIGIVATGPGSERVMGIVDNTEVYHIIAEALGLGTYGMISRPADEPECLQCVNGEGNCHGGKMGICKCTPNSGTYVPTSATMDEVSA